MTPARRRRLLVVLILLFGVAISVGLALRAFNENLLYFFSPEQVAAGEVDTGQRFTLGGLVEADSVQREAGSIEVRFVITDSVNRIPVSYSGILPDLFREGQGIVARGKLDDAGLFVADEVLAKHDEDYMPPEVAEALEKVHKDKAKTLGNTEQP